MGLSNKLSCEAGRFSRHLIPTGFFSQRFWGFFSPHWNPGLQGLSCSPVVPLGLSACKYGTSHSASHHLAHPGSPAAALLEVLSAQLPLSAPATGLDECFFFNSLVVRLLYNLISWQFWLFFVFKFVVLIWLWEEVQCIFLCLHLDQNFSFSLSFYVIKGWISTICLLFSGCMWQPRDTHVIIYVHMFRICFHPHLKQFSNSSVKLLT